MSWLNGDPEVEVERKRHQESRQRKIAPQPNGQTGWTLPDADYVRERLSLAFWYERQIAPLDSILGDLFHTTSRIMLAGPTGLGKTSFLMAASAAMADGGDFLHWLGCGRPRRVLYVDGEMSRRLLKQRLDDAVRRHGSWPATLFVLSREDFEAMPPLDIEAGQKFVDHVIDALGGVDLVTLDNVQALTVGELREPESWRKILPWIRQLTARKIGQVWAHHTNDEGRSYGDKTREWQLDTVAVLDEVERADADIAFTLKFTKARERSPQNRSDFEPALITLANDGWTSDRGNIAASKRQRPLTGAAKLGFEQLKNCMADNAVDIPASKQVPQRAKGVTLNQWRAYLEKAGVINPDGNPREQFRRIRVALQDRGLIGVWEDFVWLV